MSEEKKRSMMAYFHFGEEYDPEFSYWKYAKDYLLCPECNCTLSMGDDDHSRTCEDCDFDESDGIWVDLYDDNHEEIINEFELHRLEKSFGKYERRTNGKS